MEAIICANNPASGTLALNAAQAYALDQVERSFVFPAKQQGRAQQHV